MIRLLVRESDSPNVTDLVCVDGLYIDADDMSLFWRDPLGVWWYIPNVINPAAYQRAALEQGAVDLSGYVALEVPDEE